jgi:hypothetical protein
LGGGGAIYKRDIDSGGGGELDAGGAETFQHVGYVVGHGEGDEAGGAVVREGEAEEVGGDGGGLDVVSGGESIDEVMEVGDVSVFNTEIVDHQGKEYGTGVVGKQAGLDLVVPAGAEYIHDLFVCVKTSLAEARDGLHDRDVEEVAASAVSLDKGGDAKVGEKSRGEEGGVDDHRFRGGHVRAEIEIGNVVRAEVSVFRYGGMEEGFEDGHGASVGRAGVRYRTSVPPTRAPDPPHDSPLCPLLSGDRVVVGGAFVGVKGGDEGSEGAD